MFLVQVLVNISTLGALLAIYNLVIFFYKYIIMIIYIIIIIIIIIIAYIQPFIYFKALLPFRNISKDKINRIMIGLPCIDRDSHILYLLYDKLYESLENAIKYYDIEFILAPIMRESDLKCINFWKSKNADITLMPSYEIKGRHNWDNLVITFNKILEKARTEKFDRLILIESDIIINKETIKLLIDNIKEAHLIVAYYNIKWCNYPIILTHELIPKLENAKKYKENKIIAGHGVGCVLINKDILNNNKIKFEYKKKFNIEGQDIGFYEKINNNRYKILLLNHEVHHLYNEKKITEYLNLNRIS